MVGRENASRCDVESVGTLLKAVVGVLVQEHRGARNGWASVWHSFTALGASEHRTVERGGRALVVSRVSLARRSAFVCSQARRGGSRGGARGEAATAPTAV